MKQIKYFALALVLTAMMPGCREQQTDNDTSKQDSINAELLQSLNNAQAEKDSLMALMTEITQGMNEIQEMQNVVASKNLNAETPSQKSQLRADIAAIKASINERKKRLADLEARLKQSNNYNGELQKTIETLKQQLETQQGVIDDLTRQLASANAKIETLNTRVDSLSKVNTTIAEEKAQVQEDKRRIEDEKNECFYIVGNKKELKQHRIIETGFLRKTKLSKNDFEKSYFTKADKRTLSKISLHSKKVQIMSRHPEGSYSIEADQNGQKTLAISNPATFWEYSNFLIIKID